MFGEKYFDHGEQFPGPHLGHIVTGRNLHVSGRRDSAVEQLALINRRKLIERASHNQRGRGDAERVAAEVECGTEGEHIELRLRRDDVSPILSAHKVLRQGARSELRIVLSYLASQRDELLHRRGSIEPAAD